jgi:hypothetical protein
MDFGSSALQHLIQFQNLKFESDRVAPLLSIKHLLVGWRLMMWSDAPASSYVDNNIKKRMELITKSWEISKSMISFGSRAYAFLEYL